MEITQTQARSIVETEHAAWKRRLLIASPFIVIASCHVLAVLSAANLASWAWVPLQIFYWSLLLALCWMSGMLPAMLSAYYRQTPWRWWSLNCIVGLIPLPILLRNTSLLRMHSLVACWLAIAVINPFIEETYWRGVLGSLTSRWPTSFALLYTSLLFAFAHPLLWGVFSVGNRSWQTVAALVVMGAVWNLTFRRTNSLQAVALSHCMVDIGNMTVWVFMNFYVPPK